MIRKFLRSLANLKLAILILLLIAIIISMGSIIEQNREIQFYQKIYGYVIFGIQLWKIILFFGINNIYNTWWFFFLLFLLGLSLACCTLAQQLPTLKFSRRYYFYKQIHQFNKVTLKIEKNLVSKTHLSYNLLSKQYSLFSQYNAIYAYKGLISRIGPIIVHCSIICILLGNTLGALTGFNSQELIAKTEIFHTQNILKNGLFASVSPITFRINDFWTIYNRSNQIKQFYSDISILNSQGLEYKRKTISVNNPLLLHKLIIYQTDWSIFGIRLKFAKDNSLPITVQLPVLKVNNFNNEKLWISSLIKKSNDAKTEKILLIVKNIRGQVGLYNKEGKFIKNINIGENFDNLDLNLNNFKILDVISSTGIQIKSDPGVKLIYTGFFFLIISTIISYISFSELWLLQFSNKVIFGGKTNRAKIKFKIEFLRFQQSFY